MSAEWRADRSVVDSNRLVERGRVLQLQPPAGAPLLLVVEGIPDGQQLVAPAPDRAVHLQLEGKAAGVPQESLDGFAAVCRGEGLAHVGNMRDRRIEIPATKRNAGNDQKNQKGPRAPAPNLSKEATHRKKGSPPRWTPA